MSIESLTTADLYRRCDPAGLGFLTTAELEPLAGLIAQERAQSALRFGIGIRQDGYNLFALGPAGTGKLGLIKQTLEARAATQPVPPDWCYVFNFADAHRPRALRLPAGAGVRLQRDMERLVEDLHRAIQTVFESDEYRTRAQSFEEEMDERQEQAMGQLQAMAKDKSVVLVHTPTGFTLAPLRDGKPLGPTEFNELPEEERRRIESDIESLQAELRKTLHHLPAWRKQFEEQIQALNRELAAAAIRHLLDTLREGYSRCDQELPDVITYLGQVEADVVEHFRQFLPDQEKRPPLLGFPLTPPDEGFPWHHRYRINVLLAHDSNGGAPVVHADLPAHMNLVGRVEHRAHLGALETDFSMIRPGALHQANGGYLIIDALKLLYQPSAWETLKRLLQAREIRIESLGQVYSLISTVSLEPEPIPLDVKVVLYGERIIYYLLSQYDPEFPELFKVAVDFDDAVERGPESERLFGRLIAAIVRRGGLRAFAAGAVARVIEQAARLADDNERTTSHLRSISDLVQESDYWAGEAGREQVTAADVQRAIEAQIQRADRVSRRLREETLRGTLLVDTQGERVGQVNGLAVMDLGNFRFGHPMRITARVRLGKGEVVDIEREAKLGGPIHSKGVLILGGFIAGRYAPDHPLSLSASLVFEQSYGGVEGDSASSTELYALLSALAGVPVRQSLAVTGSVNQLGEVQAIGGVNEKIEGFYDICAARGLTGDQGVLIPAANVKHLMLRADILEAVANRRFAVYPVRSVDEGIELLTGRPAGERDATGQFPDGSINRCVEARLIGFSERLQALRKNEAGPESEGTT
jgi:lon-related putative ATP-dependent protease